MSTRTTLRWIPVLIVVLLVGQLIFGALTSSAWCGPYYKCSSYHPTYRTYKTYGYAYRMPHYTYGYYYPRPMPYYYTYSYYYGMPYYYNYGYPTYGRYYSMYRGW